MRADKRMLFDFPVSTNAAVPKRVPSPPSTVAENQTNNDNLFREHILSKASVLQDLQSHSLAVLRPGQLILHSLRRALTLSQSIQLASLARLTHERHFDSRKYDPTELLVPGGLVIGITMSASARDFHELLHEEIINVNYANPLHPDNMVGSISYIQRVEDLVGDLQLVTVRTFGIKNIDVVKELDGLDLPLELFELNDSPSQGGGIKARTIQRICKKYCPLLYNQVVVQMDRRILRQAPRQQVFLL